MDDRNGKIGAFVAGAGIDPAEIAAFVQFANEPAVQTELADLVVADVKRATTALYRWYEDGTERLPETGDLFVVLDGTRTPRCICRMLSVEIVAFAEVDDDFAFTEGEGDRTLASWRAIHTKFFEDEARESDFTFTPESLVVLQRFERIA